MNALIGSPEEIAFSNGWLNEQEVMYLIQTYGKSGYGEGLRRIFDGRGQ